MSAKGIPLNLLPPNVILYKNKLRMTLQLQNPFQHLNAANHNPSYDVFNDTNRFLYDSSIPQDIQDNNYFKVEDNEISNYHHSQYFYYGDPSMVLKIKNHSIYIKLPKWFYCFHFHGLITGYPYYFCFYFVRNLRHIRGWFRDSFIRRNFDENPKTIVSVERFIDTHYENLRINGTSFSELERVAYNNNRSGWTHAREHFQLGLCYYNTHFAKGFHFVPISNHVSPIPRCIYLA